MKTTWNIKYTCGGGCLVTKLYLTFVTPWSVASQAPLSLGFPRHQYWSGLPFPSLGGLPTHQFSSVQLLSYVWLSATPWTIVCQASLSITNSWSPLKPMTIESVMPSSHIMLCCPLLLLLSIFPSNRVFSNESVLHIRWPKYWSFSFSISPSNEYSWLISFRTDWLNLLTVQRTLKAFPTPQFKSINSSVLSFLHSLTVTSIHDYWKNHSFD